MARCQSTGSHGFGCWEEAMSEAGLIDPFGRSIHYLRLSVTDSCDFRCTYCMPEDMRFLPQHQLLSLEELAVLADAFISLGVRRIRITGGEPLMRKGLVSLLETLGARAELEDLSLTTNGNLLARYAAALKAAGVGRLNISLDSLNRERFAQFSRRDRLPQVLEGIAAARDAGFGQIRINSLIQKGRNDDEVEDLVGFAIAQGLDISFIEEMPLGRVISHSRSATLCTSEQLRQRLERRFVLLPSTHKTAGPARYWQVAGTATRVGFISPHSDNFCADCNRVRVTAQGQLVLCLGHDGAVGLRDILRNQPQPGPALRQAIINALQFKPQRHYFDTGEQVQVIRFMSATGG